MIDYRTHKINVIDSIRSYEYSYYMVKGNNIVNKHNLSDNKRLINIFHGKLGEFFIKDLLELTEDVNLEIYEGQKNVDHGDFHIGNLIIDVKSTTYKRLLPRLYINQKPSDIYLFVRIGTRNSYYTGRFLGFITQRDVRRHGIIKGNQIIIPEDKIRSIEELKEVIDDKQFTRI